ncbi:MAG: FtsW/RodA/SpoVE family cell cycle protein [Actinomycetes bacterium]
MLSVERGIVPEGLPRTRRARRRRRWRPRDLPGRLFDLLAVAAVLVLGWLSTVNLTALGAHAEAQHQALSVAIGLALCIVLASRVRRSQALHLVAWTCYVLAVAGLLAVELRGVSAYGARRWLAWGSFSFQPSELAKLGLLLVLADVLGSDRPAWRRLLTAGALAVVPIGLTTLEPDLSTATLLLLLTAAMLVLARIPMRMLVPVFGAVLLALPLAISLLRPYQLDRLHAFVSGSSSAQGSGWAALQAHIAVASGGWFGLSDQPLHLLRAQYLPGRETDFALSSLVQQRGLVAGAAAVVAVAVVVWRCALASRAPGERRANLVAGGLAMLIAVESLVSIGGNLGRLPVAGVPFPLVSYGGSAAIAHLAALGVAIGGRRAMADRRLWLPGTWLGTRPRLVRTGALATCCLLVLLALEGYRLQTGGGPALREVGQTQMTRCVPIPAPRGVITDRHGTPLATNVAKTSVRVVPGVLLGRPDGLSRLAALLGRPVTRLGASLAAHPAAPSVDVGDVSSRTAARVTAARLPGVFLAPSPRRVYPYGALLGPLLGFVGVATPADVRRAGQLSPGEYVGRVGLEQEYDSVLRGVDGEQCMYVDPGGRAVAPAGRQDPVPGADLRLTLDLGLQRVMTRNLAAALRGGPGRDLGGAVAMDPRTGQVLAMASLPSFDNSIYGPPLRSAALRRVARRPANPMLEHVTQVAAPPGSTFKLVIAAANVVHHGIPPASVIPTGGSFTYGGHVFGNWRTFGPQNMTQALAWSNDVYFYKLALALGPNAIYDVGTQLGVGRRTGIDLPGESSGFFGNPSNVAGIGAQWYGGSTVILGIGQGYLTVTPLQDALWTAGVTTGSRVTPHLGMAVVRSGVTSPLPQPAPVRLPFAGALGPVRAGMRAAVTGGTAALLRNLPVTALGKTGSAEDSNASNGKPNSWFTAAAPQHHPSIVVTSFVRGGGHGATTSGPVVDATMLYFFAHRAAVLAH